MKTMYRYFVKRFLDIFMSGIMMVVLLPIYVFISVIVILLMGWPIMFCQERIGKGNKLFRLYKFRSMTNKKDKNGELLPEKYRLTKVGRLLRSSSLDELPELWTIFIGKMSFVGPRPMPSYYAPYFFPKERDRHLVRGGLIPPDSLSLKVMTTYEEQFGYELFYVKNISFWLDLRVIYTTFVILYKRITENYGSDFRPHLNVYRSDMASYEIKAKQ